MRSTKEFVIVTLLRSDIGLNFAKFKQNLTAVCHVIRTRTTIVQLASDDE